MAVSEKSMIQVKAVLCSAVHFEMGLLVDHVD